MSEVRRRVLARLDEGRPDLAFDEAVSALRDGPPAERHRAHALLPGLAGRVPSAAWTRARALRGFEPAPTVAGRAPFPAVSARGGRIVTATATAHPGSDDRVEAAGATAAACRDALDAARAALGVTTRFEVAFDHDAFDGDSCGLAVALAAASAVTHEPVDPMVVATGRVAPDGTVGSVGGVAEKDRLRADARPLAVLLAPPDAPDRTGIARVATLRAALEAARVSEGALDALIDEMVTKDRVGDWPAAARAAKRLSTVAGLDETTRTTALVIRLAAANHEADPAAAAEVTDAIRAAFDAGLPGEVLARAFASVAVNAVDRGDADAAREVLAGTRARAWAPGAYTHIRGTEALVLVLEGRLDEAVAARRANLPADPASPERPRCLGDLADALWRAGDLDGAAQAIAEAFGALATIRTQRPYLERTRAYLCLHAARIHRLRGDAREAEVRLEQAPGLPGIDPSLRLRLERALLSGDAADAGAIAASCPSPSPVIGAILDRALAGLGDTAAEERLRGFLRAPGVPFDVLARRLPY